jgi:hypothetical protein
MIIDEDKEPLESTVSILYCLAFQALPLALMLYAGFLLTSIKAACQFKLSYPISFKRKRKLVTSTGN